MKLNAGLCRMPRSPSRWPLHAQSNWRGSTVQARSRRAASRESQSSDFAWKRLAELTDTFGNRLSGSATLEQAIDWAVAAMKADGLENVRKEPVMVPNWVRGHESLELVHAGRAAARACSASATPSARRPPASKPTSSIVKSFDDLDARGATVKGKIVLFNVPFTDYGETRPYRSDGPSTRGEARRGRDARALRRAAGTAHAAHRRAHLHGRRAEDSRGGDSDRRRRPPPAAGRSRRPRRA